MMIARAAVVVDVKMSIHTQPKRVTMLAPPDAGLNTAALEDYLRNQGFQVDRCSLEHTKPLSIAGHKIISVYELESPFLYDMQEAQFRALVDFVCSLEPGQSLLWLTRAAQIAATDPRYGLINGMARTIRSELNVKLGILELDTLDERAWEATLKVCTKLCHSGGDFEETDPDYEFALQDGIVHISRFVDVSVTDGLAMIGVEGSPRHLQIAKKGALDTLRWAATAPQENALDAADVDVDVRVAGLNNRDIFVAMGIIDGDDFGYECAGVVHAVGIEVSGVKVGDHVMVLGERALCSRVRTSSHRCIKMPPGLSFEEAATMPSIYGTVIRGLLGVGHLMREQVSKHVSPSSNMYFDARSLSKTVLVQAAAAPAGVAALHICKAIGAEVRVSPFLFKATRTSIDFQVYATTDSPEKAIFLIETFGIAQDRIFSSTDQSFLAGVMKATQGRGVDLVLNSLAGELLHASWQCVAENGIMVELGKRDITGRGKLALDLFNDNRGFFGVDIARLCNSRPWEAKNMLATLVAMYEASEIKPFQPIMTFDARNASEAFQFLQKRDHNGKVAIRMPEDVDSLPGVAVLGQRDIFRSDVSYLLVGGVGGLGQAVATWMVERGARNLMFFSRSAANRATHGAFFDQLEASGCFAQAFSGNAANFDDVKRAVSDAAKPVAGVMQMSLILRVRFSATAVRDLQAIYN
jgi:NADPH:quinone reductase-like Zn-dependent oxidoreductase